MQRQIDSIDPYLRVQKFFARDLAVHHRVHGHFVELDAFTVRAI
jgi:hypothetical protein